MEEIYNVAMLILQQWPIMIDILVRVKNKPKFQIFAHTLFKIKRIGIVGCVVEEAVNYEYTVRVR